MVTKLPANFAFLCFNRLLVKISPAINSLITFNLHPFAFPLLKCCCLLEIADICGITKKISSHTGRHSFATSVALANGVSIENVAKMLGHSDTKMTRHYARVLDKSIMRDMQVVNGMFAKPTVELTAPEAPAQASTLTSVHAQPIEMPHIIPYSQSNVVN